MQNEAQNAYKQIINHENICGSYRAMPMDDGEIGAPADFAGIIHALKSNNTEAIGRALEVIKACIERKTIESADQIGEIIGLVISIASQSPETDISLMCLRLAQEITSSKCSESVDLIQLNIIDFILKLLSTGNCERITISLSVLQNLTSKRSLAQRIRSMVSIRQLIQVLSITSDPEIYCLIATILQNISAATQEFPDFMIEDLFDSVLIILKGGPPRAKGAAVNALYIGSKGCQKSTQLFISKSVLPILHGLLLEKNTRLITSIIHTFAMLIERGIPLEQLNVAAVVNLLRAKNTKVQEAATVFIQQALARIYDEQKPKADTYLDILLRNEVHIQLARIVESGFFTSKLEALPCINIFINILPPEKIECFMSYEFIRALSVILESGTQENIDYSLQIIRNLILNAKENGRIQILLPILQDLGLEEIVEKAAEGETAVSQKIANFICEEIEKGS